MYSFTGSRTLSDKPSRPPCRARHVRARPPGLRAASVLADGVVEPLAAPLHPMLRRFGHHPPLDRRVERKRVAVARVLVPGMERDGMRQAAYGRQPPKRQWEWGWGQPPAQHRTEKGGHATHPGNARAAERRGRQRERERERAPHPHTSNPCGRRCASASTGSDCGVNGKPVPCLGVRTVRGPHATEASRAPGSSL